MEKHEDSKDIQVLQTTEVVCEDRVANDELLAETHEGEFGTRRDLSSRVVSMIAIAGTIGTGLFLGSGSALTLGGPVGAWLGYTLMGAFVGMMMYSLGEMTCFAPNVGGFIEFGTKYVDPAMGFMLGINAILQYGLTVPAELAAIAVMISYWDSAVNRAGAYIAAFLVLAMVSNVVGVKWYGEVEFVFACIKVLTLIGLILFGLIANVGGIPPDHTYIGGKYWREEPFNDTFMGIQNVTTARFLGFWAVLTKAAFSYGGIESLGILAGEAHNPRKTMRMAVRTVFYRIVGIYTLAILIIGLNISQKSPDLLDAVAQGGATAASSPFVVICLQTGVNVLPSIINAVVITSALSACNENVYAVSRTLMAMAKNGSMPKSFLVTNRFGVPWQGIVVSFCFGLLAFLTLSSGSAQAFVWLSNLSALSSLIAWTSISYCFTRFQKVLKVQGVDRRKLVLRSWFQPYMAWAGVVFFSLVILFNGFRCFIGGFQLSNFFASYVTLPLIALCFVGFKLVKKTKLVDPYDVDLGGAPASALVGTQYDSGDVVYVEEK